MMTQIYLCVKLETFVWEQKQRFEGLNQDSTMQNIMENVSELPTPTFKEKTI